MRSVELPDLQRGTARGSRLFQRCPSASFAQGLVGVADGVRQLLAACDTQQGVAPGEMRFDVAEVFQMRTCDDRFSGNSGFQHIVPADCRQRSTHENR